MTDLEGLKAAAEFCEDNGLTNAAMAVRQAIAALERAERLEKHASELRDEAAIAWQQRAERQSGTLKLIRERANTALISDEQNPALRDIAKWAHRALVPAPPHSARVDHRDDCAVVKWAMGPDPLGKGVDQAPACDCGAPTPRGRRNDGLFGRWLALAHQRPQGALLR